MIKQVNLLFDIVFYFALPILFWEIGRVYFSDYLSILISSLPGISYSIYRFLQTNGANFTRLFLFLNILIGLLIDLCSGTALQILWNDAYYSLGLCIVYLISCFFRKPLFFYFALDILVLQGYDRKMTKEILLKKGALKTLRIMSLVNGMKELLFTILLMELLPRHGVEIYTFSILLDQLISFIMSGISIIGYLYLYKLINEMVVVNKISERKKPLSLPAKWYHLFLESSYFFLRKHFF